MSRSVSAAPYGRSNSPFSPLVILGAVSLVALTAVTLFELATWDKIAPGVSTLGIPIGGLSQTDALDRLAPDVQQRLDRPLEIRGGGQVWHTSARELGLRLDPGELVGAAYQVGRFGSPVDRLGDQLDAFSRGHMVSPANTNDRPALEQSLTGLAQKIDRAPVDARLSLDPGSGAVQTNPAQEGAAVDVAASRDRLTAALDTGSPAVELVIRSVPAAISDTQLQAASAQLDKLVGASTDPMTLTLGEQHWALDHADILKLVSITGGTRPGEAAVVNIGDAPIKALAARIAKDVDQPVADARFQFSGGSLKVLRASHQGREVDQAKLVQGVRTALLPGERQVVVPVETVEPKVSSDNPQALGITELIDRGSTSFAGSIPEKKANIKLAASRLNGIVVAPGETFSFNDAIGPTTLDAGFQWGFAIASGNNGPQTIPSVAGGICQVATTLFQPVFWSGYQLEERYWHLYWIPAYTSRGVVGLDVTVDGDSGLDFKWTNTTSTYVLIQSDSDEEKVYFGLYGKKPDWKVQVDDAVISNRIPPDTTPIAQEEPTLPWGRTLTVETARDGFDAQVVHRVIPSDGGKARELSLKSTYQPAHTVTLVGSGGKPAGASVAAAIERVLDAQRPAEPKPTVAAAVAQPTIAPGATAAPNQPVTGTPGAAVNRPATPPAAATTVPATAPTVAPPAPTVAPPAQPTAAPKPAAPTPVPATEQAPAPTTLPNPTPKPAVANTAPTPVPGR